jgi:methyl-accepting chemotaxis protein
MRIGETTPMPLLADPLFWIAAVLAAAVVALSLALRHQRAQRAGLEASRRDSFERTATELASAAKGLLGNVSSVTTTSAEAVDHVRATTETMTHLTHTAMTTAVSAETVIGLAMQSERAADEALAAAEERGNELARLAEDVRAMAARIARLNVAMRELFETAAMVGYVAERSQRLAESASAEVANAGEGAGFHGVAEEMGRHAEDARRAAHQVRAVLGEVQQAMAGAMTAAEAGERRAAAGAELVQKTRKTIHDLASALRESSGAAKHIAGVAQQQESKFDEVLRAMNNIYLATEKSLASTGQVAREARSLDELATSLRRAIEP